MAKQLFLLDGMALVYRAHFAFAARPILTSQGRNTSALYGFTQSLLDILANRQPTHLVVAFDTAAPTERHREYPEYKIQREEMPEDIRFALPNVRRIIEALNIRVVTCDGYEADDLIGTLVTRAEPEGFESFMVTPDKDFGQLVSAHTFLFKPARLGDAIEILGVPEILAKWGIHEPMQVADVLGLWGDAVDNIPGVPGIGEKTAAKLIAQYGSVENVLAHTAELKGKLKENLETHRERALLSKRLATINRAAPIPLNFDEFQVRPPQDALLRQLCVEFEFNSIGRRLFGESFRAGHGFSPSAPPAPGPAKPAPAAEPLEFRLTADDEEIAAPPTPAPAAPAPHLKTIRDVAHEYHLVTDAVGRAELLAELRARTSFCFDTETTGLDTKQARLVGLAFSFAPHTGWYVPVPQDPVAAAALLEEFRSVLEDEKIEKVGHNLKYDLSVLRWHGLGVRGRLFDTMIAHALVEPDQRHGMDYLSEVYLGYSPVPITALIGPEKGPQLSMAVVPVAQVAEYAAEDADVTWQLRGLLEPLLRERGQEKVFYEVEAPLLPVLVAMEHEGIRIDAAALAEFAAQLGREMTELEAAIHRLAGRPFNLNSPRQLGEVLFEELKIGGPAKKTKTGQYSTNEQTLQDLAPDHEIVQRLLDFRGAAKLKSTYADTLPESIWPATGRVHTTYNQVVTATGRLNSQHPNLQNIPIRTEQGREIRKAFVPRDADHCLLAADYSQIELRIIAALSGETAMIQAFRDHLDVHAATAAKVFGVPLDGVTPEMRRRAKMVNFGIIYGISAFGLAQRLRIPRKEAATIIEQYFALYPGIARYMQETIEQARRRGYVETVIGRRRYIRDINSANATVRGAAERNAINAPIQGTAADMIKLAMIHIQSALAQGGFRTRMLLQVHDELVFDVPRDEVATVRPLIEEKLRNAISLPVPIEVETGVGQTWLEAH